MVVQHPFHEFITKSLLVVSGQGDAVMSIAGVLDMINSKRIPLKDREAMVALATQELFFTASQAQVRTVLCLHTLCGR